MDIYLLSNTQIFAESNTLADFRCVIPSVNGLNRLQKWEVCLDWISLNGKVADSNFDGIIKVFCNNIESGLTSAGYETCLARFTIEDGNEFIFHQFESRAFYELNVTNFNQFHISIKDNKNKIIAFHTGYPTALKLVIRQMTSQEINIRCSSEDDINKGKYPHTFTIKLPSPIILPLNLRKLSLSRMIITDDFYVLGDNESITFKIFPPWFLSSKENFLEERGWFNDSDKPPPSQTKMNKDEHTSYVIKVTDSCFNRVINNEITRAQMLDYINNEIKRLNMIHIAFKGSRNSDRFYLEFVSSEGTVTVTNKLAGFLGFDFPGRNDDSRSSLYGVPGTQFLFPNPYNGGYGKPNYCLLYTNIIENCVIGETTAPLLKVIPLMNVFEDPVQFLEKEFVHEEHSLIRNGRLDFITFHIRDVTGKHLNFKEGCIVCLDLKIKS